MTAFQIILILIGSLVTLFFIISFFLPSNKSLHKSIVIKRPPEKIYKLVTDFGNYKKWNPWSAREPDAKGEVSEEPGHSGHKWSWEGKIIGSGSLEIKELKENSSIVSDLVFTAPRKMRAKDIWKFERTDNSFTRVTWGHKAFLEYPIGRFFGLFLEKMLGAEFEKGLENLKKLAESSHIDE